MERQGPLEEITVLDFGSGLAAPYGTVLLSDFGADVISIEPPGGGGQREMLRGGAIPNDERNKRSIIIDLKNDSSSEIMESLIKESDVLVHNFRPDVTSRLGYDYDTVKNINSEIIYCSVTGFGEQGEYKDRPAVDPVVQAMSGMMSNTGEPDRKPSRVGASPHDHGTGVFTALAIMVALWHRNRTGEGQKIETSLFDTAAAFMNYWYTIYSKTGEVPERQGHAWAGYAPVGVYDTKDKPIYLATSSQRLWEKFCKAIDKEEWVNDTDFKVNEDRIANRGLLEEKIEEVFSSYTRDDILELLLDAGVPAGEINDIPAAANNEHLHNRGTITRIEDVDGRDVLTVNTPIKLSRTPPGIDSPPPKPGEHSTEILENLGFSQDKITRLHESNVIQGDLE